MRARSQPGGDPRRTSEPMISSSRACASPIPLLPRRRRRSKRFTSRPVPSTRPSRAYTGLAYVHNNRSVDVIAGVQPQPDEHRLSALRLAEQALALDPNDPRVHSTLAMMSTRVRDFERGERHFDLARAMNPNDAMIQIHWAWIQGVVGKPQRGMAAA